MYYASASSQGNNGPYKKWRIRSCIWKTLCWRSASGIWKGIKLSLKKKRRFKISSSRQERWKEWNLSCISSTTMATSKTWQATTTLTRKAGRTCSMGSSMATMTHCHAYQCQRMMNLPLQVQGVHFDLPDNKHKVNYQRQRAQCKYCNHKGHFNFECHVPHKLCHFQEWKKCLIPTQHRSYKPAEYPICAYNRVHSVHMWKQRQRAVDAQEWGRVELRQTQVCLRQSYDRWGIQLLEKLSQWLAILQRLMQHKSKKLHNNLKIIYDILYHLIFQKHIWSCDSD